MIQYRLIKEYPGSPKLEFSHNEKHSNFKGFEYYDSFPEFWLKVEELDYEVLAVKYSDQIRELKQGAYRILDFGIGFTLDYVLGNGGTIHSVKRLSDGEVFTIGDKINFKEFGDKGFQRIERFEIDDFYKNNIAAYHSAYGLGVLMWEKQKEPLFTTEDRVDIFEGEYFFYPNTHTWEVQKADATKKMLGYVVDVNHYRTFSTKEKAQEYVLYNKPCLSINDIGANIPTLTLLRLLENVKLKI